MGEDSAWDGIILTTIVLILTNEESMVPNLGKSFTFKWNNSISNYDENFS